jgi:hypothetical protein
MAHTIGCNTSPRISPFHRFQLKRRMGIMIEAMTMMMDKAIANIPTYI